MTEVSVGSSDELSDGDRLIIEIEGKELAIFNINGEYHAYVNWCPHQAGPICEGDMTGTVEERFDRETLQSETEWIREGEILRCPWHGWQFDVTSGECLSRSVRLVSYPVVEKDGELIVSV